MSHIESPKLEFIKQHLRHAERMEIAHRHADKRDTMLGIEWYSRPDVIAKVPDPAQILQRLPYALFCEEALSVIGSSKVFYFSMIAQELLYENNDAATKAALDAVRTMIFRTFEHAHVFGCFRPTRYADFSDLTGGASSSFMLQAEFLAWGCEKAVMNKFAKSLAKHYEPLLEHVPATTVFPLKDKDVMEAYLDIISLPDRQMNFDPGGLYAYEAAMDHCAEAELKQLMKAWSFNDLIISVGDGDMLRANTRTWLSHVSSQA